jgi:hypothetical protein
MMNMERPVSVLEIEKFIKEERPELGNKLRGKSIDYVRVTLGTTPKGVFVKFKCPEGMRLSEGESQKKIFWGIKGMEYGNAWCQIGESAGKKSRREVGERKDVRDVRDGRDVRDVREVCDERVLCEERKEVCGDVDVLLGGEKELCGGLRTEQDPWESCGYDLFDPWSPGFFAWEY